MSITLATTWRPRGELARFARLLPQIEQGYEQIVIALPSNIDPIDLEQIRTLTAGRSVALVLSPQPFGNRQLALQQALHTSTAGHIHLVDMDRLLRWVETQPDEWRQTVTAVAKRDCLIMGRTPHALETHPQALQQTEQVINTVFSHLLGQPVDLGGGSRGFSRRCVEYLLAHSAPGSWEDARWPMLLHQAGFQVDYLAVDGLDWESADRHRNHAADAHVQREVADAYDADPRHWARRVEIAQEIIAAGLCVVTHDLA
ncbi:MAG: hypothetical protein R3C14_51135 [Caldilineaceae bacterium]